MSPVGLPANRQPANAGPDPRRRRALAVLLGVLGVAFCALGAWILRDYYVKDDADSEEWRYWVSALAMGFGPGGFLLGGAYTLLNGQGGQDGPRGNVGGRAGGGGGGTRGR